MNETVNVPCTKLDDYKAERKKRKHLIRNLEENVSVMSKKVENLAKETDKLEQYSHRNCILVHGIAESDDVVTDDLVIETISNKMNIEISPVDLDRRHRIGTQNTGQNKPIPIMVKLSRYNVKNMVFFSIKKT